MKYPVTINMKKKFNTRSRRLYSTFKKRFLYETELNLNPDTFDSDKFLDETTDWYWKIFVNNPTNPLTTIT